MTNCTTTDTLAGRHAAEHGEQPQQQHERPSPTLIGKHTTPQAATVNYQNRYWAETLRGSVLLPVQQPEWSTTLPPLLCRYAASALSPCRL